MSNRPQQHGFERTVCGCEFCRAPCRHIPGSLDVSDLERLCPPGRDIFAWAEEHLVALVDKSCPTLVPARGVNGHCHWLFQDLCVVHENAPFGCSFFDSHMSDEEAKIRADATMQARRDDAQANGLYYRVWMHLQARGRVGRSGDRDGLADDVRKLQRTINKNMRRSGDQSE
ncbi:MAG: hypothetical protein AB7K24_22475 [Gemmataceae bacterium]